MLTATTWRCRAAPVLGALFGAWLAISCDSEKGSRITPGGGGAQSGGGEGSGKAGSLQFAGSQNEGNTGGASQGVSREDACASSSDLTEALPPVVQLVVDTSGSMAWPPGWAPKTPNDSKPPGATKWEITRDALRRAVAALPDDVALGASFYPNVQQEGDVCLDNQVAAPLALLGEASVRESFEASLSGVTPIGATPTHGAYLFGLGRLTESTLPGSRVLLLITDGTPTCDIECHCTEDNEAVDSQPLLDEAAAAAAAGVRTFVIGSPGSEPVRELLSRLAVVGGTAPESCQEAGPDFCHFDMTSEPDLAAGLAAALAEIGQSIRSCEYPIPAPPAGKTLQTDRVNVLYTPPGEATLTIGRDPSEQTCTEGWQYSEDGKHIVLCGQACERAKLEPSGVVEVLFGCETVVSDPR